jgi:hypothetical protein
MPTAIRQTTQQLGVPGIESMKNPPIEWKKWKGVSEPVEK